MEDYIMEYIVYVLLLLSLIILFIVLKDKKKLTEENLNLKEKSLEEIKTYFRKEWEEEEKELEHKKKLEEVKILKELTDVTNDYCRQKDKLDKEIEILLTQLEEKEKRYNEVNQDLDLYRQGKIKEIDSTAIEYEQRKRLLVDASIVQYRELRNKLYNEELSSMQAQKETLENEIKTIKSELEEERIKRAAINEEILRQKQIEEQQDFYRIQLDPNEIGDIEILRDTARRLQRPEIINKIIWSGYYQKPLAELRKRLLPNGDISGVYKITRLKTNEIYIGQTTSIDKRWQEHVKSALGVGTLASSQLHRIMAADGPENFTFEILEEVPKDKLRERESYYIDFYDSKNYGLNSVTGDKK
jgi:hypothetical protein